MISKELLTEVLGLYEVYEVYSVYDDNAPEFNSNSEIAFEYFGKEEDICIDDDYACSSNMQDMVINIYELAHKCKEWALTRHEYKLYSTIGFCKFFWSYTDSIGVMRGYEKYFDDNTEPEAIFKACQWILDNKDNQC